MHARLLRCSPFVKLVLLTFPYDSVTVTSPSFGPNDMASRHSLLVSMLSSRQLAAFDQLQGALVADPSCLEHHKAHKNDKFASRPTVEVGEVTNVQPKSSE